MINIPQIPVYKFKFQLEALEDMNLPKYKGSMFRGAFGTAFRRSVCVTKLKFCDNCILKSQCSYFNIFETEIPGNNIKVLNKVKKHPHPFVLHPPLEQRREYSRGEVINLNLTIFGKYITHFPYFLLTIIKMGQSGISYKRCKLEVLNVTNLLSDHGTKIIYKNADSKLNTKYEPINFTNILKLFPSKNADIKLRFLTPLRIQNGSNIIYDKGLINFDLIFRNVLRRLNIISKLYCDSEEEINLYLPDIITLENKLKLFKWERYSNRQQDKIEMNGFVGSIIFKGVSPEAVKLIKLASFMNIGKNTVFGLGEYDLEIL
ncbi:MAG: CRISPR system precrRNA processing endoribonuclease RAMP protein Cas6 [Melioribacteraceae bacterium]|nr:CRISPR system precrRNA processing endoribonuclease RAMP protein Cas6 [Melioribacteraceae bacterium]